MILDASMIKNPALSGTVPALIAAIAEPRKRREI
jgi:monomeric isocitrate dehydrogenase